MPADASVLDPLAEQVAARLIGRGETVAVAESSAGGLVSAALLRVDGASRFYLGGAVVYTVTARAALLGIDHAAMEGLRPASEPYAALLARTVAERHGANWGLGETGAAGPTGNRYGDPAGHGCIAIAGPTALSATLATGSADRAANMVTFAERLLALLVRALD